MVACELAEHGDLHRWRFAFFAREEGCGIDLYEFLDEKPPDPPALPARARAHSLPPGGRGGGKGRDQGLSGLKRMMLGLLAASSI